MMEQALQIIAYQRDKLRAMDEYIKALELAIKALGSALLVLAVTVIYLF